MFCSLSLSCLDVSDNNVICVLVCVWVVPPTRARISPQHPVPHARSSYCILWQHDVVKSLSSMTRLCLHRLQSSEHFQAGHAPPAHPLPRGLCIYEEAVRAVFSPEWAQPSSAQQGPLQPGLSALRGQVQCGWRVDIWIWTPTGPQQHVGFPSSYLIYYNCINGNLRQRKHEYNYSSVQPVYLKMHIQLNISVNLHYENTQKHFSFLFYSKGW